MSTRMAEERKRLGLTQDEIAKKLGIPKRTYCDYEYGVSELKESFLKKIESVFGINVATYVMFGIRIPTNAENEPSTNSVNFNEKKIVSLIGDLNDTQKADVIKVIEEKRRLNQCEIELEEFKKKAS